MPAGDWQLHVENTRQDQTDFGESKMQNTLTNCPRCGGTLGSGFATRAAGLSFVSPDKFEHYAFMDEDLTHAGLRKFFPGPAEYYRSFICRECELYIVDYSKIYSREEAEGLARSA